MPCRFTQVHDVVIIPFVTEFYRVLLKSNCIQVGELDQATDANRDV